MAQGLQFERYVVNLQIGADLYQEWAEEGNHPSPPGSDHLVTQAHDYIVTQGGNRFLIRN